MCMYCKVLIDNEFWDIFVVLEWFCGFLDVFMSIKSNYNYSLGNKVILIGCRKGILFGIKEYICVVMGKDLSI